MAAPFASIVESDLGAGIDQQSAENALQPAYCERLLNVDPTPEGSLRKRPGHQSHLGHLPVRVASIQYTDDAQDQILLTLDQSISLASVRSTPLVVYGRTAKPQAGDFGATNSATYYEGFTITQPVAVPTGTSTLTLEGATHGLPTSEIEVVLLEAATLNSTSNRAFEPDSISIDVSTRDVSIQVTNSTGNTFNAYVALIDRSARAGEQFVSSPVTVPIGAQTIQVTAATHQLNSFSIQSLLLLDATSTYEVVQPDEVRILTNGTVELDVMNSTGSSFDVIVCLGVVPTAQIENGTIDPTSSVVESFSTQTPFNAVTIMYEPTPGADLEEVKPDEVEYDELTSELRISFTNSSTDSINYFIYWTPALLIVNTLQLTGTQISAGEAYIDDEPQLSIFGLDHVGLYVKGSPRPGWVHHLDLYRSTAEERLIAALGGVVHREVLTSPALKMQDEAYPRLRGRLDQSRVIRPCFVAALPPVNERRTRGHIIGSNVDARGRAPIDSIEWDAVNEAVEVRVRFTDGTLSTGLSTIVPNLQGVLADELTIEGSPLPRHEGRYEVLIVTPQTDGADLIIRFLIRNPKIKDASWDQGPGGFAAIYTDRLSFLATTEFIAGDRIRAETFPEGLEVRGASTDQVQVRGITRTIGAPGGIRVTGMRKGRCIPLRDVDGTPGVEEVLAGDSLRVQGQERMHRVHSVHVADSASVTISGDGEVATLEASTGVLDSLKVGSRILITGSAAYSGEHEVLSFPNEVRLTFAHPSTDSQSATLIGKCVTIDEDRTWRDPPGNEEVWQVAGRFIPVDGPTATDDLPEPSRRRTFQQASYVNQPFIRSTMVQDATYLTNGLDEIYKYDGQHVYRAGIPRFQCRLFATPDTSLTAAINLGNPTVTLRANAPGNPSSSGTTYFLDTADDALDLSVGERLVDDRDGALYVVRESDSITGTVRVDRNIAATGDGSITRATELTYYARISAIDRNGAIVSSATSGSEDIRVTIGSNAAVRLRLLAPPPLGIYDFDRWEVEIYRREEGATFRKVRSLQVPFDSRTTYIDVLDTDAPEVLVDDDAVVANRDADGLGVTWSDPPRAKALTSADGRLLLANVETYPEIDLQWTRIVKDVEDDDLFATGNSILTLRRDSSSTSSTTNMSDVIRFEWKTTATAQNFTVGGIQNGLTFEPSDVNVTDDEITVVGHLAETGQKVQVDSSTTLPGGLSAATDYFIIVVDDDTVKLATSAANAEAGIAIDLTSQGTGDHIILYPDDSPVMTVNATGIDVDVGNWVYLYHAAPANDKSLQYAGWFQVASRIDADQFRVRYKHPGSYAAGSDDVNRVMKATDPDDVPVPIGIDGNYNTRRGQSTSLSATPLRVGVQRLSDAINAVQRATDRLIPGQESFRPWIVAEAGGSYEAGQLRLRQPYVAEVPFAVELDEYTSVMRIFGNEVRRPPGAIVESTSRVYPSRVLISYANFPEIFDDPDADATQSDSTVDVNPADGQEIVGLIPFFGESAFGAAQKSGVVVIFKMNSIYLLDVATRELTRVDSQGLGCTQPRSIAYTKDAIIFANSAGIYRLTHGLKVEYVGQKMERIWRREVDRDSVDLPCGHHYAEGQAYKLSIPQTGDAENSLVLTYAHTREYVSGGFGSWTLYDSHPATDWCNRREDAYFASTRGRVFEVRRDASELPFRDDDRPIVAEATLRSMDFGHGGTRKRFGPCTVHFRTDATDASIQVEAAVDSSRTFRSCDPSQVRGARKISTIQYSLPERKGTHLQLRIRGEELDEPMEISTVDFRVAATGPDGVTQAKDTK